MTCHQCNLLEMVIFFPCQDLIAKPNKRAWTFQNIDISFPLMLQCFLLCPILPLEGSSLQLVHVHVTPHGETLHHF